MSADFRAIYGARLFPVNKTTAVRIRGEGLKDLRVDEFAFALARTRPEDVQVVLEHDEADCVGRALNVVPVKGWWHAEFVLDPAVISARTEERLKPGMNVSAGYDVIWSETHHLSGIETVHEALLREISICREGMCPGARIVSKWQVPARRAAAPRSAPAPSPKSRFAKGDELLVYAGDRLVARAVPAGWVGLSYDDPRVSWSV